MDEELRGWLEEARRRTEDLVAGLDGAALMGPRLAIVNPLLWEVGHVGWFEERWVLRRARRHPPLRADADALYDSTAIPHDARWDLPLPPIAETLAYVRAVRERVLTGGAPGAPVEEEDYFLRLALFHEDMHAEAFTYTRQTLAYPAPAFRAPAPPLAAEVAHAGPLEGDAFVPGGRFRLGAEPGEGFVFDNEKWAHEVTVEPFWMARAAVTNEELRRFVEDGGYEREAYWSPEGWRWRRAADVRQPLYWKENHPGEWIRRHFDLWVPLEPHAAAIHVSWFEADAWARWAGRRLPTEAEWEMAAACSPAPSGGAVSPKKRRFPWGAAPPCARRANLDWRAMGTIDVGALPDGDSAFGVRQMVGNVWEWTSTELQPYPGFVADPYEEYSAPWFGDHKVLRGGCWTTRAHLLRNTWRNFYKPDRRDVYAGFRTCRR